MGLGFAGRLGSFANRAESLTATPAGLVALIATVAIALIMWWHGSDLKTRAAPEGIGSLELAWTVPQAKKHCRILGGEFKESRRPNPLGLSIHSSIFNATVLYWHGSSSRRPPGSAGRSVPCGDLHCMGR